MESSINIDRAQQFFRCVGRTPMIRVGPHLYAKLETVNPTGSIKDRLIAFIVHRALLEGKIGPGTTLVEATSGNTGISLSAVGAALGLPVRIIMPSNMSEERKQMMRVFGAQIQEVGPSDFQAAIRTRNELVSSDPTMWSPMQFENRQNTLCHLMGTAHEIAGQIPSTMPWSAFVSGAGTGGTISGIAEYTRNVLLDTKVILVRPIEEGHLHGIQGIGDGGDYLSRPNEYHGEVRVATADARERASRFARETGLLVGISAGANLVASERWIEENNPEGAVVTILCDRGERYLSSV